MYELVVKGGEVIDPAQKIHERRDIGISQGKIAAVAREIAASEAKKVINAQGKIVTPGLIDIHLHVADGIVPIGIAPDEAGVFSGVTTVCDGGSIGYANFSGFKRYVIPQAQTDVFCYLNVCSTGLAVMPEIRSWHNIDAEATIKTAVENRDVVRGIKLRAIGTIAENLGVEAVRVAKRIATEAGIPLQVHVGDMRKSIPGDIVDSFTRELLPILDKGDILIHLYTWEAGGVIKPDGSVLPELNEAIERGVLLDSAHGLYHLSFDIAKLGLAQGILPHTISTDLAAMNAQWPVISLLVTMSKFLTLGLSLEQVIETTTINPARVLGEDQRRGTLKIGMPADISILELTEGDFSFSDGKGGNTLNGKLLLVPSLTLKSGVEIIPSSIT